MAEVDENMKRIFVKGNQYNVLFTFDSDETNKTNIDIGVKAYQQKNYQLAELIFAHTDAKEAQNNLAYMIRRGEVKEPSEYNKRMIAETLKEGVHEQEPFYMINMSLFWALNIGGEEAWKLADSIMSTIPDKDIHSEVEWWLNVGQTGDVEGYLVHYWLLKYDKISSSPLGTKKDIRKYISQSIKKMPDYI